VPKGEVWLLRERTWRGTLIEMDYNLPEERKEFLMMIRGFWVEYFK
jgi:hypothetical protein